MRWRLLIAWAAGVAVITAAAPILAPAVGPSPVAADEGWVIRSFDVEYSVKESGDIAVTEDIRVDFGSLEKHGIFRDIPVEYTFDEKNNRLIKVSGVTVDDGAQPVPFELLGGRPSLRIKIGDPDKLVSGQQRYRISYTLTGGLSAFTDHDEFYWNVTGDQWPVAIERATATVAVPKPGIQRVACYEGSAGSTLPCESSFSEAQAIFAATARLPEGAGLTIVVGTGKGVVQAGAPELVRAGGQSVGDFLGLGALPLAVAGVVTLAVFGALTRLWWLAGRDRWFGNMFYATENPQADTKPLFSQETIVVEYQPPEVERLHRRLRAAEIGLLLDERADTLDVSATIVELAVRKYLTIKELDSGGILGLFKSRDYEVTSLEKTPGDLLPYERTLIDALFESGTTVKLSDLKNKFNDDLAKVKSELYAESVSQLQLFPQNPDTVRWIYRIAGGVIAGVGVALAYLLGTALGAGVIGIPVALGGALLFALAHLMPRRTAEGRLMYRRCLGFRLYMVTAEKEREKFAEKANIFEEYLPYAIVYGCVKKWAGAFEGLGLEGRQMDWYSGSQGFVPLAFAESVGDFSSSISSVMASTPGGSGFGGGSSGGGGGGGGGGSW